MSLQKKLNCANSRIQELEYKVAKMDQQLRQTKIAANREKADWEDEMERMKRDYERVLRDHDFKYKGLLRLYNRLRDVKKWKIVGLSDENIELKRDVKGLIRMVTDIIRSNVINMMSASEKKHHHDTLYRSAQLRHENGIDVVNEVSERTNIPLVTQILNWHCDMNYLKINNERLAPMCKDYEKIWKKMKKETEEYKKEKEGKVKEERMEKYKVIQKKITKESVEKMRKRLEVFLKLYPENSEVHEVQRVLENFEVEPYLESVENAKKNLEEGEIEATDSVEEVFDGHFWACYDFLSEDVRFQNYRIMEDVEHYDLMKEAEKKKKEERRKNPSDVVKRYLRENDLIGDDSQVGNETTD